MEQKRKKKKEGTGRFDGLWKSLIEKLPDEFIAFFFPNEVEDYDVSTIRDMNTELEVILPNKDDKRIKKFVDKLVSIERKSAKGKEILLHIEVDSTDRALFADRMHYYRTLIFGKFQKPMNGLVVFTGNRKRHSNQYRTSEGITSVVYEFGTYSVLEQSVDILKNSDNPMAIIIYATQLKLTKMKLSVDELKSAFNWLYNKVEKLELLDIKKQILQIYLGDCVRICLEDCENYASFVMEIEVITKNKNIMGLIETIKEEGRQEKMAESRKIEARAEAKIARAEAKVAKVEAKIARSEVTIAKAEAKVAKVESNISNALRAMLNDSSFTISKIAAILSLSESFVRKSKKQLQNA